ncbi:hypothetical protein [Natribacillus halophilus]|uniref:Uncharacterized protein n=1 Tax=Natribacillus halophilus TaxID=549003 RepID=A0A1G8MST2_9BACI|nr:hypothetical protein [Natribacillus halophilus]SDI71099.1 hypothetical protein SAMN04488123_1057 [Natribacillus halophilus]
MFDLFDLLRLLVSAFFILPIVSVIRETGYFFVATLLGATNKHITIGAGPVLFYLPSIEVRWYFFMTSWISYDEIRPDHKFWHILIYASPMISNIIVALIVNSLLGAEVLGGEIFWNTFLFYTFYFVLFDALPVYQPNGEPTNGRAIYDVIRHNHWHTSERRYDDPEHPAARTKEQEETIKNSEKDMKQREGSRDRNQ